MYIYAYIHSIVYSTVHNYNYTAFISVLEDFHPEQLEKVREAIQLSRVKQQSKKPQMQLIVKA